MITDHIYSAEWGEGSPCSICMGAWNEHRFKSDGELLGTVLKSIKEHNPSAYYTAIWDTGTERLIRD